MFSYFFFYMVSLLSKFQVNIVFGSKVIASSANK